MAKRLSIPEQHQLKIARRTLELSEIGAQIMGMTHQQAREIILALTGKAATQKS